MINLTEWLCILFMVCLGLSEVNAEPPNVQLPLNNTVLEDQACSFWATQGMHIQVGRQQVAHKLGTNDLPTLFEDFVHRVFRSIEKRELAPIEGKYALQVGEWIFKNVPLKLHKRATGTEMFNRCKEDSSVLPTFTQGDLKQVEPKEDGIEI